MPQPSQPAAERRIHQQMLHGRRGGGQDDRGIPAGALADALEAAAAGLHVRFQHRVHVIDATEVAVADDAIAGADARGLGARGDAGDEFGLADRTQFLGAAIAIGEAALNEHGGPHVVSRPEIGAQFIEQVAPVAFPQVMMRIDDRQRGFDDVLAQLGKPRLVDVRVRVGLGFLDRRAHRRSPCLDGHSLVIAGGARQSP